MKQCTRYAVAGDRVQIAWSDIGRGLPMVRAATWLTHLQYDMESPVWAHWIRFFGERFRYIRYDERGCGLSDWNAGDLTPAYWLGDLECVIDAAAIDRPFALLGISQGAAPAIQYAVRHPERISHLILYGGYAVGGLRRDDPAECAMFKAVMDVVGLGWGSRNPAFRRLFSERFVPQGSPAQIEWFNELCRRTTSAANAVNLLAARGDVDVRDELPKVRVPTLVLHSSHDHIAPLAQGKLLASHIPDAVFVQLESHNHVLLEHEPAWQEFQNAVMEFTGQTAAAMDADNPPSASLTRRERMLLDLLCAGRSNAQIGWELGIAEKTVRNHATNLYRKLGVRSRAEAIVQAYRRPA